LPWFTRRALAIIFLIGLISEQITSLTYRRDSRGAIPAGRRATHQRALREHVLSAG
jgi:hypothetical protein